MSDNLLKNYCIILGISPGASDLEIKKAYREKAKQYHPDVNDAPGANTQFILINEAYTYLINPERRKPASETKHDKQNKQARYEHWLRRERAKARAKAEEHARMRFEEFKKTRIYKTSRLITELVDYVYLVLGIMILVIPIVHVAINGLNDKYPERTVAGIIGTSIIGAIFIVMLGMSKIELKNGKISFKRNRIWDDEF